MANTRSARDEITAAVTSWPGVHAVPGDLGELGFKLGRREIGHLHGDRAAHFSFPKKLWAELREQGRIVPHQVFPDSQGPAARSIENDADVREVIALFRLNYDRAVARNGLAGEARGEGMNAKASGRQATVKDGATDVAHDIRRDRRHRAARSRPGHRRW